MTEFQPHTEHHFPLERLLERLQLAGFQIAPSDRLHLMQALKGMGMVHLEDWSQLKYILAPVLVRSAAEQDLFYREFDAYLKEIRRPIPVVKTQKRLAPFWKWVWIWLGVLLLGAAITYLFFRQQQIQNLKNLDLGPILAATSGHPLTDSVTFYLRDSSNYLEEAGQWSLATDSGEEIPPYQPPTVGRFSWQLRLQDIREAAPKARQVRFSIKPKFGQNWERSQSFELNLDCPFYLRSPNLFVVRKNTAGSSSNLLNTDSLYTQTVRTGARVTISDTVFHPLADTFGIELGESTAPQGPNVPWQVQVQINEGGKIFRKDSTILPTNQAIAPPFSHIFQDTGLYEVHLHIQPGYENLNCPKQQYRLWVKVQTRSQLIAAPPKLPVLKDDSSVAVLRLSSIFGVVFIFLGLISLLNGILYRYYRRQQLARQEQEEKGSTELPPATLKQLETKDGPPYKIPFPEHDASVAAHEESFLLANALRRRQQGLNPRLDIRGTIKATAQDAGMPHFRYDYGSQPSEYLVLIDKEAPEGHQMHLMEALVQQLIDQDVLITRFFYHTNFLHFHNEEHPSGLTLEMLYRKYPFHRLLVFGDGHNLLDPYQRIDAGLRPYESSYLLNWDFLLLLTPRPAQDWDRREQQLYHLFQLLPADPLGFIEAIDFIEAVQDNEERDEKLDFQKLQEKLEQERREPTQNFRRWHRMEDLQQYLKDYPELFTWLCALAVFPEINWSVTLAIGEALHSKGKGVEVNFQNLLILARIEWLRTAIWPPRLRMQLLEHLKVQNPEALEIARKTLRDEIRSVEKQLEQSHANQQAQLTLMIQDYMLNPEDEELRNTALALRNEGFLTTEQTQEMALVAEKEVAANQSVVFQQIQRLVAIGQFETAFSILEEPQWSEKYGLGGTLRSLNYLIQDYRLLQQELAGRIPEEEPIQKEVSYSNNLSSPQTPDFSESLYEPPGSEELFIAKKEIQGHFQEAFDQIEQNLSSNEQAAPFVGRRLPVWAWVVNGVLLVLTALTLSGALWLNRSDLLQSEDFQSAINLGTQATWWATKEIKEGSDAYLLNVGVDAYNRRITPLPTTELQDEFYDRFVDSIARTYSISDGLAATIIYELSGQSKELQKLASYIDGFDPSFLKPILTNAEREALSDIFQDGFGVDLNQGSAVLDTVALKKNLKTLPLLQFNAAAFFEYVQERGAAPTRLMAFDNLGNLYFNEAVDQMVAQENMESARSFYLLARNNPDSLQSPGSQHRELEALHGIGLSYYFENSYDTAQLYVDTLLQRTSNRYFDTLSYQPNLRNLLENRPIEVDSAYLAAKETILGQHLISLQWINDQDVSKFGSITFREVNGVIQARGAQRQTTPKRIREYLEVEGTVEIISATEFILDGRVTISVEEFNAGKPCTRSGRLLFQARYGRRYWRMQQIDSPCANEVDYVDIYFR